MRSLVVIGVVLATGCSTVLPSQTASTVRPGVFRLGAQTSLSPWCGPPTFPPQCDAQPNGIPIPELRVSGRHGVANGMDVGLSASASTALSERANGVELLGLRLGVVADGKAELWSRPAGSGRHLLSAGAGFGYESQQSLAELQVSVPLWYGYQLDDGREVFAGPRFLQRVVLQDIDGDARPEALHIPSFGFSAGYASPGPVRFITTVEYFASTAFPVHGTFNLTAGVLWDLGG